MKTVKVIRPDSKNKGKFRIVKLILKPNGVLRKASTVKRNLSYSEAENSINNPFNPLKP